MYNCTYIHIYIYIHKRFFIGLTESKRSPPGWVADAGKLQMPSCNKNVVVYIPLVGHFLFYAHVFICETCHRATLSPLVLV